MAKCALCGGLAKGYLSWRWPRRGSRHDALRQAATALAALAILDDLPSAEPAEFALLAAASYRRAQVAVEAAGAHHCKAALSR
jgi:hypothetical protein